MYSFPRYDSFAPRRSNNPVKWYVDGKDYFSDVADAIMKAQEEIFITDWWLSPEIFLKRSQSTISMSRLDQLLQRKVRVWVVGILTQVKCHIVADFPLSLFLTFQFCSFVVVLIFIILRSISPTAPYHFANSLYPLTHRRRKVWRYTCCCTKRWRCR